MAGCSAGSPECGMDEIRRMLEDFNQQQRECPEHQLEPVSEWSQTMVEKLQLREDHDILLIAPETAVSKILSSGENTSKRAALQKFFSEHLSEMNFHTAINNVEATLAEFISCPSDEEKTKILPKLVDNLRNAKSLIKDPERFEKAILGLDNLDEFVKVFAKLTSSYWNDSAVIEPLISDISELSLTLLPLAEDIRNIMKATKLEKFLCNKISLSKLTEITSANAGQSVDNAAWRLLRGLTNCNYKVRNEAGVSSSSSSQSGNGLSWREKLKKRDSKASTLHPMDVLHASFLCCDAVTKQFLCQRLFACKLAFPFLYRNELNQLVQSDWALRDICFEFSDNDGKSIEMSLMSDSHQLPVVSFVRIGELMVSKSKALNHLLNPVNHETFFNRHSENGTLRRTCSDGLVEAAVRLPTRGSQAPMFLALNLRGDMESHAEQTDQLIQMSHICVLFACGKELCDEDNVERIKSIKQKVSGMVIVVSKHESCKIDEDKLFDACEQHFDTLGIIIIIVNLSSASLSDADFIKDFKLKLDELLLQSRNSPPLLQNVLSNRDPAVDAPLKAVSLAAELYEQLCQNSQKIGCAFQLQRDPWKKLSDHQRAQYSVPNSGAPGYSADKLLKKCREKQIELFENQQCLSLFITHLRELNKTSGQYAYFESLRFLLESHTRKQSPGLRRSYLEFKCSFESSLATWRTQSSSDRAVRLPAEIQELEQQLKRAESEYEESKVELNHFFRELSLVYDAHAHINEADIPGPIQELPRLFASLLLSGMPLELLDGNVGNIPMEWISAVLLECKRQVGDKKLFVVSVLGTQSTGKSTLLNTMFGLRLPVSSGRCTRGAFLQLVRVDESSQLPFDYLALVDTEGLRAIERSGNNQRHDNELATLVIGLADLTLITVNGEDSPDMRDVLQIVIHAFIRMKGVQSSLDMKRRCLFVHQNVSDAGAIEKLRTEIMARQSELDKVTRTAAEKACVTGVSSFSDIILFSPDSDTFLMPSPWYGDPPTAPVNEGFSNEVQKLKQHIIKHHQDVNGQCLSFTDFTLRTKDLWRAVQTENFVFSFRNSIEIKAYRLLDEEFAQIRSLLRTNSFEFLESTIKLRVTDVATGEKVDEQIKNLKKAHKNIEAELLSYVDDLFRTSNSQLKKYFSDSEYKHCISQWEAAKLSSLQTAKEELQRELKRELRGLIRIRKIILKQDAKTDEIQSDLLKKASNSFVQSSNADDLTEEKMRQGFNSFWTKTLNEIAQAEAPDIEAKLKDALLHKLPNDQPLIEAVLSKAPISSPATDRDCIKEITELTGTSAGDPTVLKTIEKNVLDYLCDFESKRRSFEDSDAKKVIDHTFYLLSNKMPTEQNSLKVQVAVYACRLAHRKFCDMQAKFVTEQSLKSKLEKEKDSYLKIFKHPKDAAKTLFQMRFQSEMQEMLTSKALSKLKKFLQLDVKNSKRQLIKLLLKHGIDEDPSVTELYLTDPKAAALKFITLQTEKILLQSSNSSGQREYWSEIEKGILNTRDKLLEAIQKPEIHTSDSLIVAFCRACSSYGIPFKKNRMEKICQDGKLSFEELSNILIQKIPQAGSVVLENFKKLFQYKAKHDKLSEVESLCSNIRDSLWGCEHRCPLCSEPCMMMDANHADNDKTPHRCAQHRPMGLKGTGLHHKNEIAKYTCSYFETNISAVMQGAKSVFGAQKKFQCSGCSRRQTDCSKESETELVFHKCFKYKTYFPDWDIEPDYSAPVSDLWKWLASSNRDRLVAESKYYSKIPVEWKEATKESAKLSLEKIYGDSESTVEPEQSGADVSADVGNRCQNEVVPFGQPNAIALSTIAER